MGLFTVICSRCGSSIQIDKEQTEGKSTSVAIDVNSDHFIQCTAKLFGQTAKSNILFLNKTALIDELYIDVYNEKLTYRIEISKEQKQPAPTPEKSNKEKEPKKNGFSILESVKKTYKNITKK